MDTAGQDDPRRDAASTGSGAADPAVAPGPTSSPSLMLLLAAGCFVLNQGIAALLWSGGHPLLALAAAALLGVCLPTVAVLWALEVPWRAGLGLWPLRLADVALVLWVLIAVLPCTYALGAATSRWFPPSDAQLELSRALLPTDWKSVVAGVLAGGVLAPLAEEILFRRLVPSGLGRLVGEPLAVLSAAGLFAVSHGSLSMLPPMFLLGSLLGLLVWRTGKLSAAWLAHGLYNLVAYIDLCLTHDVRGARLEALSLRPFVWLPAAGLLAAAIAWALQSRNEPGASVRAFPPSCPPGR